MNETPTTAPTPFDPWFETFSKSRQYKELLEEPVAYFCAEYALFNHSPLYAGGLGILAGDYVNEMIDQKFPSVCVGLFYHHEHTYGKTSPDEVATPEQLGLELVRTESEDPHIITVPIAGRDVRVQAWRWRQGTVTLFLLDTRIAENDIEDQSITDNLYVENRDMRLKQEMVLGIGGMRFLKALGIHPSVYHLNEGHSAFLAFELIRHEMKHRQVDFNMACQFARQHIVFTNHTLDGAGHELFVLQTIKFMAQDFARELGINIEQLIALGVVGGSDLFSMTTLALNLSCKVNAVSALHGKKAAELWKNYNVEEVTNGIYVNRWDVLKERDHQQSKKALIDLVKEKTGVVFDENVLTLGWARRFVPYKQPLAILGDVQKFKELALREGKKIQLIFSGPLNEAYIGENDFIKQLSALIKGELKGLVVFLPNYDIALSRMLVSGCDVWLNTPIVGTEACGTSGMKACLNGTLLLSTNDGWVAETDLKEIGWVIDDKNITHDLLDVIEKEIVPLYYSDRSAWGNRMDLGRQLISTQFSTARALKQYIETLYLPTLLNKKHLT